MGKRASVARELKRGERIWPVPSEPSPPGSLAKLVEDEVAEQAIYFSVGIIHAATIFHPNLATPTDALCAQREAVDAQHLFLSAPYTFGILSAAAKLFVDCHG